MTWVLLSLMYSFGLQSSRIVAVLPPPGTQAANTIAQASTVQRPGPDVDFSLLVSGTLWRWDTLAFFMLPGEQRTFKISSPDNEGGFEWSADDGSFLGSAERERRYTAPSNPGRYRMRISRGRHEKKANVFVMVPYRGQEAINGYQIGRYPKRSHFTRLGLPRGFVEVTPATMNAWLSPHFRLKEFVCHQPSNFPKYVVLREGLIRKLELLMARAERAGIRCSGMGIVSGYRTPFFNQCSGNVENSVHTYGGAADVYVDADNDGVMDDLNYNGKRDIGDAIALYKTADLLERENPELSGGDGYYPGNGAHGPFIHTDIRGERSRWHE
jgi:hypothetical protein